MLQKEVALKFDYNLPNMNKYKFLARIVSDFKICFNVSKNVFFLLLKLHLQLLNLNLIKKS